MHLKEIANSPVAYQWDELYDDYGQATFTVGPHEYYFCATKYDADSDLPKRWDVEFGQITANGSKITNTGTGYQFNVFATVIAIARQFFATHPADCIVCSATDSARQRIYKRFINRLLPTWNITQNDVVLIATSPTIDK